MHCGYRSPVWAWIGFANAHEVFHVAKAAVLKNRDQKMEKALPPIFDPQFFKKNTPLQRAQVQGRSLSLSLFLSWYRSSVLFFF